MCALDDATPKGMAASSFTSVSLDPALVSVCVQHTSTTSPILRRLPRLGISILAEDQHTAGRALASRSDDRFAGIGWHATDHGAVLLDDAAAWLEYSLEEELPAGDHSIALLRIHRLACHAERSPLVFHASRFRQLATAS